MAKLSSIKQEESMKVLVYGESGAGKTVFATSFPGPVFVHDFDKKIVSAANFWRTHNVEKLDQIDYTDYSAIVGRGNDQASIDKDTTKQRFSTFYTWLVEQQNLVREGKFIYKTVVLDSLTLWSELLLKEVIRQAEGKIAQPIKNMEGNAGMQHYQLNQRFFKEYLGTFLDLPCNVIVTAHVEVEKDDMTGEILRRPKATGKLASYLPIIFGEVYRAYVETVAGKSVYRLQTQTDARYNCRTQLSGLAPVVESSFKSLIKTTV